MTTEFAGLSVACVVVVTAAAGRGAAARWRRGRVLRRLPARGPVEPPEADRPGWFPLAFLRCRLERALAAAALTADPAAVSTTWLLSTGVATGVAAARAGTGAALVVVAVGVAGPAGWLYSARGRGAALYEASLPALLESVGRSLRAGSGVLEALALAGAGAPAPVAADIARVTSTARRGGGMVGGLEDWARRRPLPAVSLAAAALCLGAETGGAQARAVDGLAQTLRQRLAVAAEVRALSSQARASALVIAAAPLAFGAFAVGTDAGTAEFLFRTPVGLAVLVTGLLLDGAGALWMGRIVRGP